MNESGTSETLQPSLPDHHQGNQPPGEAPSTDSDQRDFVTDIHEQGNAGMFAVNEGFKPVKPNPAKQTPESVRAQLPQQSLHAPIPESPVQGDGFSGPHVQFINIADIEKRLAEEQLAPKPLLARLKKFFGRK